MYQDLEILVRSTGLAVSSGFAGQARLANLVDPTRNRKTTNFSMTSRFSKTIDPVSTGCPANSVDPPGSGI